MSQSENGKPTRVLFFGALADMVAESDAAYMHESAVTAEAIYAHFGEHSRELKSARGNTLIQVALNQQLVDWDTEVEPGSELAFLPPVTGG